LWDKQKHDRVFLPGAVLLEVKVRGYGRVKDMVKVRSQRGTAVAGMPGMAGKKLNGDEHQGGGTMNREVLELMKIMVLQYECLSRNAFHV
jgi:hypothetical protein